MNIDKVNIAQKFALFSDHWSPKVAGELNGQHIKLVKLQGEFTWHKHENEDEMFLVIKGTLMMELRDKTLQINPGEFIIIPKGTEHKPVAHEEAHVMLFEPSGTSNTGDRQNEFTKTELDII